MGKNSGQREIRPVWNNTQRINHQSKFVPSAVLTRSGRVPVSAAKQSSFRAAASTGAVKQVNTTTHTNRVNVSKLRTNAFHKVNGVNTDGQTTVNAVKGNGGNPQQALKNKGIFNSGCSRHMTGNKDFLIDYQDIDEGFVAFDGSARGGKITGKGKIRTDKKNSVLFLKLNVLFCVLDFKYFDASKYCLEFQAKQYVYVLKIVILLEDLTCLFTKSLTQKVEENLHVNFLENKPNVAGQRPNWLFDIDSLTNSMNYQPVTAGNQTNKNAGPQEANGDTADDAAGETPVQKLASENEQALKNVLDKMKDQEKEASGQSDAVRKDTPVNAVSAPRTSNDAGPSFVPLGGSFPDDPLIPDLEDTAKTSDFNNMEPLTVVSPIPSTRVHSIHPKDQIIGDPRSVVQTKGMTKKSSGEHAMIASTKNM
ncbi:hypothetical protein Tco_1107082 [Tanacetum coccineum]